MAEISVDTVVNKGVNRLAELCREAKENALYGVVGVEVIFVQGVAKSLRYTQQTNERSDN